MLIWTYAVPTTFCSILFLAFFPIVSSSGLIIIIELRPWLSGCASTITISWDQSQFLQRGDQIKKRRMGCKQVINIIGLLWGIDRWSRGWTPKKNIPNCARRMSKIAALNHFTALCFYIKKKLQSIPIISCFIRKYLGIEWFFSARTFKPVTMHLFKDILYFVCALCIPFPEYCPRKTASIAIWNTRNRIRQKGK